MSPAGVRALVRVYLSTWLWRLICVLGAVLAVTAIVTATAWQKRDVGASAVPVPPYPTPTVAHAMLTSRGLGSAVHHQVVQVEDGPPVTKLYESSGPLAQFTLQATQLGAWHRQWLTPDRKSVITVQMIEFRTRALALKDSQCHPAERFPVPGASQAGSEWSGTQSGAACAWAASGRTSANVEVAVQSRHPSADVKSVLSAVAAAQFPRLPNAPDLPNVEQRNSHVRDVINLILYLGLLAVGAVLTAPNLVDKAARRRLRTRLRGGLKHGFPLVNVEPLAKRDRWMTRALGTARFAGYLWALHAAEDLHVGFVPTFGLLLAAFVVAGGVERWVRGRAVAPTLSGSFRGWARVWAVLSLVLTAGIVAVGAAVAVTAVAMRAFGVNPLGPDYELGQVSVLVGLAGVALVAFALVPFTWARRLAMRRLKTAARDDDRPAILLLRSFTDDRRKLRSRRLDRASMVERLCLRRRERFEEIVVYGLNRFGAVEGLGEPGQRLPPALGAVRRDFGHDVWKGGVQELIGRAKLIAVTLGRTDSLMWEIGQIAAAGALQRTIFVLPPTGIHEQHLRLRALSHALGVPWMALGYRAASGNVLAVVWPVGTDRPLLIIASSPDDLSYENAIEVAVSLLRPEEKVSMTAASVAGLSVRMPLDDAAVVSEPGLEIFPPGQAPQRKPLYWRWWSGWAAALLLPAIPAVLVAFVLRQDPQLYSHVRLGDATATSIVQDGRSDKIYAVLDEHVLGTIDFKSKEFTTVLRSTEAITDIAVEGDVAYVESELDGTVRALSLKRHNVLWKHEKLGSITRFTLNESSIDVLSPSKRTIYRLSSSDGRVLESRRLPGLPWDVARAENGDLAVALYDQAEILTLDPLSLAITRRAKTIQHPNEFVHRGSSLWIESALEHKVVPVGPGAGGSDQPIVLTNQHAILASSSRWLAISGLDRISLFGSGPASPAPRRHPLPLSDLSALCVTDDGTVVVGNHGSIERLS